MKVSVIIPSDRATDDLERTLAALAAQESRHEIEVVVVASRALDVGAGARVVVVEERNPAIRRNRGVEESTGEVLAFTDDDATPSTSWVEKAILRMEDDPEILAVGGPDPAPIDSPPSELISETLLATRWIGSGVACHENRRERFDVRTASDLALVNLFVRRNAFEKAGGFDESIGYIGEDTALIERLIREGRVVYDPDVEVRHRRRAFPRAYLRQRFRYRVKTGSLLVRGSRAYARNGKILGFLAAGVGFIATSVVAPEIGIVLLSLYVLSTTALGIVHTRLSPRWWPMIPIAFGVHHATYFLGMLTGIARGLTGRR